MHSLYSSRQGCSFFIFAFQFFFVANRIYWLLVSLLLIAVYADEVRKHFADNRRSIREVLVRSGYTRIPLIAMNSGRLISMYYDDDDYDDDDEEDVDDNRVIGEKRALANAYLKFRHSVEGRKFCTETKFEKLHYKKYQVFENLVIVRKFR